MDPDRLLRTYLKQSHAASAESKRTLRERLAALGPRPPLDSQAYYSQQSPQWDYDRAVNRIYFAHYGTTTHARYCLLAKAYLRLGPDGIAKAEPGCRLELTNGEIKFVLRLIANTLNERGTSQVEVGLAVLDAYSALAAHQRATVDRINNYPQVLWDRRAGRDARRRERARVLSPAWSGMTSDPFGV